MKQYILLILMPFILKANEAPIAILTIPKTGTKQLVKLVGSITGKNKGCNIGAICKDRNLSNEQRKERLLNFPIPQNRFYCSHFVNPDEINSFIEAFPDTRIMVGIRDIKDTLVSAVFHISNSLGNFNNKKRLANFKYDREAWNSLSFDEKLRRLIIAKKESYTYINQLQALLNIVNCPNVLLIRFEDLVGSKGGGDDQKQKDLIQKIANFISYPLTPKQIDEIASNLFGGTTTFRKGQINSSKGLFSKNNEDLYNLHFKQISEQLDRAIIQNESTHSLPFRPCQQAQDQSGQKA